MSNMQNEEKKGFFSQIKRKLKKIPVSLLSDQTFYAVFLCSFSSF